jgi:hypothetical protein
MKWSLLFSRREKGLGDEGEVLDTAFTLLSAVFD